MTQEFAIPTEYSNLTEEETFARIREAKKIIGKELIILGHHYQRDEVYQFADITGDSLKLSQEAASHPDVKYIVFCGVHFMAETADILNKGNKIVTLPDLRAGCPMADMAPIGRVKKIWKRLVNICQEEPIPITYINSSAELKAFCAEKGGTVCTSSNAAKILNWGLNQNKKILFLPDMHLGGNVARDTGIPNEKIVTFTTKTPQEQVRQAQVILWQGHCPVHNKFTKQAYLESKKQRPNLQLIAHPECPQEVYEIADYTGSTSKIIQTIESAAPGSEWAIGTETHLVGRLKKQHPDKHIEILSSPSCMCSMMDRISPQHLLWNLESISKHNSPINQISVPQKTAESARKGLDIMLSLS